MKRSKGGAGGVSICEMTLPQMHDAMESLSGLPCPPPDAPNQAELWAAYEVASGFCLSARFLPPEQARRDAVNFILQNPASPLEMTRPHIERGLGRKLSDDEIDLRMLLD